MDFTYDDEQLALQEVARGALERACGPDVVRQLADGSDGITPALWSTLADLGWTGLLVPEEHGGSGAGLLEMCVVLEEMGRVPLPGPFFSSSVAATSATTRQRHGWHSHTNRRNCQQRDHCLTQHCHSPSEISLPTSTTIRRWQSIRRNATGFDITVTQLLAIEG